MTVVIGVDVATRSVRAVAVDADGTVLAEASREISALEASYGRFHAALVSRGWLDGG